MTINNEALSRILEDNDRRLDDLMLAIPDLHCFAADAYVAFFGVRTDDGAGIVHIFPHEDTREAHQRVRDELDRGLIEVMPEGGAWERSAEFVPELSSYCIRIFDIRRSATPQRLFEELLITASPEGSFGELPGDPEADEESSDTA